MNRRAAVQGSLLGPKWLIGFSPPKKERKKEDPRGNGPKESIGSWVVGWIIKDKERKKKGDVGLNTRWFIVATVK